VKQSTYSNFLYNDGKCYDTKKNLCLRNTTDADLSAITQNRIATYMSSTKQDARAIGLLCQSWSGRLESMRRIELVRSFLHLLFDCMHVLGRTYQLVILGLTLTAEAEHAITTSSTGRPETARSSTTRPVTTVHDNHDVRTFISSLSDAIEKEKTHPRDEMQARACLGWIHWHLGDVQSAISALPTSIEQKYTQMNETGIESSNWTRVCAIRSTYIQGVARLRSDAASDALEIFESALPIVQLNTKERGKEERIWTELYLSNFCMASSHAVRSQTSNLLETEALSAFRAWADLLDGTSTTPNGGRAPGANVSRRTVWQEYYRLLSTILENDMPYPTTSLITAYADLSTKSRQRAELKKVESRYEALILSEIQFPKAEESSEEIEDFIDLVMKNWRIMCGALWQDKDLGDGGAEVMSRGVLDILYRAATKTFHSTSLLRHLFTVHLTIAEFDLAFKAFDTYMEIVKKGKARVEKTGVPEKGLDTDENVLRTASEYIKALCKYGGKDESKKAKEIGTYFETWLDKHYPSKQSDGDASNNTKHETLQPAVISPRVFAVMWRSIGIAYAQWARVTFDGAARSDVQLKAIQCLRKALAEEYESRNDIETLFALGTILAERRELSPAVDVVKAGLLPSASIDHSTSLGPYAGPFAKERALIPLWHLLALLLSARQEFVTAVRSCEGAFEQFQDPKVLFGTEELTGTFRSEHLNEKTLSRNSGIVDDMDDFEKENVLEVKITQLSLIEVLEGPEVAVNASDELLSLYSRLFWRAS